MTGGGGGGGGVNRAQQVQGVTYTATAILCLEKHKCVF